MLEYSVFLFLNIVFLLQTKKLYFYLICLQNIFAIALWLVQVIFSTLQTCSNVLFRQQWLSGTLPCNTYSVPHSELMNINITQSERGLKLFKYYSLFLCIIADFYMPCSQSDLCWMTMPGGATMYIKLCSLAQLWIG